MCDEGCTFHPRNPYRQQKAGGRTRRTPGEPPGCEVPAAVYCDRRYQGRSPPGKVALSLSSVETQPAPSVLSADLQDFKLDVQHVIEVDEGNTAVIACHLPESHPKAQVRYSVKQEWLEASRGE